MSNTPSDTKNSADDLAEALYRAWAMHILRTENIAQPLWWCLRDDIKAIFRTLADDLGQAIPRGGRDA